MREIFIINPFPLIMLARFGILLLATVVFVWLYSVIRLHFSKFDKFSMKQSVKIYLIESSLIAIILFAFYFSVFVTMNEWQRYVWHEWRWSFSDNIYFMLLPEIVMFISLNALFINSLLHLKKNKS